MVEVLYSSAHTVGESNLHLLFTPAYRRDVFSSRALRDATTRLLQEQAEKLGVVLAALDYGPDHVHLFVTHWKRHGISTLTQQFKGTTSRTLRQHHKELFVDKLWGQKFWSGGYFYRTVGVVTVRRYVSESQTKHWTNNTATQQTLVAYS